MWPALRRRASNWRYGKSGPKRRGSSTGDQSQDQGRELRYGSWEFRVASDFVRRLPYSPSAPVLMGSVVRDPAVVRAFVAVWRLPVVSLQIQRADARAWSGAYAGPVGRTLSSGRRAQAVLDLPTAEKQYLAGHRKQALRTNLRHARHAGVISGRVPTYEAWHEAVKVILHSRGDEPAETVEINQPGPGQQVAYYVARDADETPLAFARVALLGQFAVLFTLLSHQDRHPSASWARYQLHTFLCLDLGCSGVKHLIVGSALRETTGNQYFQHLLGYRARNLRLEVIDHKLAGRPAQRAETPGGKRVRLWSHASWARP